MHANINLNMIKKFSSIIQDASDHPVHLSKGKQGIHYVPKSYVMLD